MNWLALASGLLKLLNEVIAIWHKQQLKQEVRREYNAVAMANSLRALQFQLDVAAGRQSAPDFLRPDATDITGLARVSCPVCGTTYDLSQPSGVGLPPATG